MSFIEQGSSGRAVRSGKNSTFELKFFLKDYSTTSLALLAMTSAGTGTIPASVIVDGFTLSNREYSVEPQGAGDKYHKGTVRYSHKESTKNTSQNTVLQDTGDIESTIDFTLGKKFIKRASTTTIKGTTAPDPNKFIGWNHITGQTKGANVDGPQGMLNYTLMVTAATATDAYIQTRLDMLGGVNDATFKGKDAGTCRLARMQLRQRSKDGDVHITYGIQYQPKDVLDLATLDIGETGNMDIYPFRLYELIEEEEPTTSGGRTFMTPKALGFYEHQLAEVPEVDFTNLGV